MIGMLDGTLEYKDATVALILAGGIGFEVQMPASELATMPPVGSAVRVYTHLSVNENTGVNLMGFLTRDELQMFRLLITVSGVGPKAALGILSTMEPSDLSVAIMSGDEATIAKAPGIGKKTAAKIVLDLKDKMDWQSLAGTEAAAAVSGTVPAPSGGGTAAAEATEALMALGYSRTEASKAVSKVENAKDLDADDILSRALRYL